MTGTLDTLLTAATRRLEHAGEHPRLDAELLLCHALGRERSYLRAHPELQPEAAQARAFETLVEARARGEPIAYLTSKREFWSLPLSVSPATLIPRPETERLVELALERIPRDLQLRVLDLGTGSGAIALAIAKERPLSRVSATDKSTAALEVAMGNAKSLGISNVEFIQGDWFAPLLSQRFYLIVSNPPYVRQGDPHLGEGDLRFEPQTALVAGPGGLEDLQHLIREAPAHLEPGGSLLLEHGLDQAAEVRELLRANGFQQVETWRDLSGHERVSGAVCANEGRPG